MTTKKIKSAPNAPEWNHWLNYQTVKLHQACALAVNVDPGKLKKYQVEAWKNNYSYQLPLNENYEVHESQDRFGKLLSLLKNNIQRIKHTSLNDVCLPEFAAWCGSIGEKLPSQLAALAKNVSQDEPGAKVEDVPDISPRGNNWLTQPPADDNAAKLAELFDPVPVNALEKTFPAGGKWAKWAERAARNGLDVARVKRGKFNPYKAAMWFLNQGIDGWDLARCHRTLANNLPARSLDDKHLLIDTIG